MFNTPQDIPQPVAMAVTIEPAGGVPAPTGDKYLVGVFSRRTLVFQGASGSRSGSFKRDGH